MTVFQLSAAYLADLIFGDPHGYPHPVRLIGRVAQALEQKLLDAQDPALKQYLLGGILTLLVVAGAGLSAWGIIRVFQWVHPVLSSLAAIFFAYTTLATRNLYDEVNKVAKLLEDGDLAGARQGAGFLVSRDTDHLDQQEIGRALIETVSENTSDGIVAPLFFLAIGGPSLAMAYKALNTLDSMVGYKNERYRFFGWTAARTDDLVNLLPARLTAFFYVLSAFFLGKNWSGAWKIAWKDGRKNTSPNSGYPEAAVAGALGIQLGGKNLYFGKAVEKPLIGENRTPIGLNEVKGSLRLMMGTSLIAAIFAALTTIFI
jgi:adenosylcobinamide-phosphate synthase